MRLALIASAAVALPLAACSKEPSVSATNATAQEVREKVAAATGSNDGVMVRTGRWEGAVTIHDIDMPGMPAQVKDQMKAQMGGARAFVNCVTDEDVKQQKAFFTGDDNDRNCKYDRFSLAGGKIDATMACNRGDGGKMAMTMTGSYSAERYHLDMATKAEAAGPMGAMTMKMSVEAKRVGACTGAEDER